jgi:hypothetical protein
VSFQFEVVHVSVGRCFGLSFGFNIWSFHLLKPLEQMALSRTVDGSEEHFVSSVFGSRYVRNNLPK